MTYKVKLDHFEGPFDLLVFLIERAEMSIYDIRIAEITGQYLDCLGEMERQDIVPAAEFMVLAATLIEIKSRMLLPRRAIDDSNGAEGDPRAELVEKILEYKRYKQAAELLEQQLRLAEQVYTKPQEEMADYDQAAETFLQLRIEPFIASFAAFLERRRRRSEIRDRYSRMENYRMTVRTRINQLKQQLQGKRKVRFDDLFPEPPDRYQVVLTFLSVLEMLRRRAVRVKQEVNFGEMILTPTAALAGVRFDKEGDIEYGEPSDR